MGNNFKFLSDNYITGSSQLGASSGTDTLYNLLDRNEDTSWQSVGEGTDGTPATVSFYPASGFGTLSRFIMKNHNLAAFEVYYDGTESNVLTPLISVSGNSSGNYYAEFGTQSVGTITIKATATFPANAEKRIGGMFFGSEQFEVASNPDTYEPITRKKGFDLGMSDGGVKSYWLSGKFYADLTFRYVGTAELANFHDLYFDHSSFYFMPTPTIGTGWDGDAWKVNWVGDYDAMKLTEGIAIAVGYDVNMPLWEVSG